MEIIDISPLVSEDSAVFPGDTNFSQDVLMDCDQGDHLGLSSFKTTPHIGAHADAPKHYGAGQQDIASRDLQLYMGPCQVIHVDLPKSSRILKEHLPEKILAPRVLFRTDSFKDPNVWTSNFCGLSPEVIHYLAENGVTTVGIDTPSVDLAYDKELLSHHAILERNMAILEGIVLSHVDEGIYFLSALPLKLKNLDASPVRAALIKGLV